MILKNLLLRLGGTVRIQVRGAAVERFLNICARHDIVLRDIYRVEAGEIRATVTLADFRRLRTVMGRTGCRVHLLGRRGAPFVAHRFARRYVLCGGVLVLAAACWVLLRFVWVLHMPVPCGVSGREVSRNLRELGVEIGMRISALDAKKTQQEMLRRMPELAFIALNLHGNRLDVELHARTPKPEMLDEDTPTDVRARTAGVLTRVTATGGQMLKKPGETVAAGDIVISSLVPSMKEGGQARLTHGSGEVEARTWHEQTSRRAAVMLRKTYPDREKTRYALVFGKKRVNLYLKSGISDTRCDKIVREQKLVLADSFEVPVHLVQETLRYYETAPAQMPPEALRRDMTRCAQERLAAGIDGSITASSAVLRPLAGGAELTLYAECLEQIGQEAVTTQEVPPPSAAGGENSP